MQLTYPSQLPITDYRQDIVDAIRANQVVVVAGETGSGKTTQLPKMCLEAERGRQGLIGCTQPRRLAAVAIAARLAEEMGPDGDLVGYKIRFKDNTRIKTRIKMMTDGILLAEARSDRLLRRYDTIIIDEAHERSLNIDFLLGFLHRLLARRPELKLLITSATIDTEKFAAAFGGAPVISVRGRTYPVEVRYMEEEKTEGEEEGYVERAVREVLQLHASASGGDILVFMPTERDVRETIDSLRAALSRDSGTFKRDAVLLPLFGRLTGQEQGRVFQPVQGRKIVVATNVAETSLTVPGIRYVVDTGLARTKFYNPRAGTAKMPIAKISQASCEQRKGRCGRVGPGICIRLYSEEDFFNRSHYTVPEILRANLADVILRMLAFRLGDPARFPFIDPPHPRALRDGYALLAELGAIRGEKARRGGWQLTFCGAIMARLPVDPRLSRMLIEARQFGCLREICFIAAALSIQDPRIRPAGQEKEADRLHAELTGQGSDFLAFVNIWQAFDALYAQKVGQSALRRFCRQHFLSFQRMMEWRDIHEQILSILDAEEGFHSNLEEAAPDRVHRAVLSGHLRFIACKKEKNTYLAAHGRECAIFPGSYLFNKAGNWIVAAEMVETSRLYARTVAGIEVEWIEPLAAGLAKVSHSEPHWEKKRGQVVAFEKQTLFGLVIVARRKVDFGKVDPDEARRIFIQGALVEGNLGGNFPFFEKNEALRCKLEEMEDRLRSRTLVIDDSTIFAFYDRELPVEVHDRKSLTRFFRGQKSADILVMREDDLAGQLPGAEELEQFPGRLRVGEASLALSYVFDPGGVEDGITVHIPVELLDSLAPAPFDWLVPGLLEEKIVFLLKGLPKTLRRKLVPIPETASRLKKNLSFAVGSFYAALEKELQSLCGECVGRRDWPLAELPAHLKMRFCLERQGRAILCSRNFEELQTGAVDSRPSRAFLKLQENFRRHDVDAGVLEGLDAKIPLLGSDRRLAGYGYTVLQPVEGGRIELTLTADSAEAAAINREGMLALYQREFSREWRLLKKDIGLSRTEWPLLEGLMPHDAFDRMLLHFVLETVFDCRDGRLVSLENFRRRTAAVRKQGLYPLCRQLEERIKAILRQRRELLNDLREMAGQFGDPLMQERLTSVKLELDALVGPDFLKQGDEIYLSSTPRYLQALAIRLQRLRHAPLKDKQKEEQLAPFVERLQQACRQQEASPEFKKLLEEFAVMLQEMKISLYAQEMKTVLPVSFKRLEEKWRQLEGFCLSG